MAVIIVLVLVVVLICGAFLLRRRNLCDSYGPESYPIIGCLIPFWKNQSRLCEWYTELLRDSPTQTMTVERLDAIRTVVTANPENVEHILKTRFENYPKGRIFNEILHDLLGNGIFNADGESWRMQRKIASYEFNTKSLRNFIVDCVQSETTDRLLPLLEQASQSGSFLDFQDVLRQFSFDNVCKVASGMDPNCLDLTLPESEFAEAMDVESYLSSKRARSVIGFVMPLQNKCHISNFRNMRKNQ